MKIIETLSDYISEEIGDAHKYAKCAIKYRGERQELAKLFYALSLEEMDHMTRLHNAVVSIIEQHKREKGEPPADMKRLYDYLHGVQIDRAKEVQTLQEMYRTGVI